MIKLRDIVFDCLSSVDWEQLYKDKLNLVDIASFIQNNTDLLYEYLNDIYNNKQEELVRIDVDSIVASLDGILNLLDGLQDTAEEEGLWNPPLSDTIKD